MSILYARATWLTRRRSRSTGWRRQPPRDRTHFGLRETRSLGGARARRRAMDSCSAARWRTRITARRAGSVPGLLGRRARTSHRTAARRHRLAAVAGYARRGGLYARRVSQLRRSHRRLQLRSHRRRVVQHIPILRENWVLSLRGRMQTTLDGDDRYRTSCCRRSAAAARCAATAAGASAIGTACCCRREWRWIPDRLGAGHGALLRRRQGREPDAERSELRRPQERHRHRHALPRPGGDAPAHRAGPRARRDAPRLRCRSRRFEDFS